MEVVAQPSVEREAVRVNPHCDRHVCGVQAVDGEGEFGGRLHRRLVRFSPAVELGDELPAPQVVGEPVPLHQLLDALWQCATHDVLERERSDRAHLGVDDPRIVGKADPELRIGLNESQKPFEVDVRHTIASDFEVDLIVSGRLRDRRLVDQRLGFGSGGRAKASSLPP